jgi:hypothetical protein
MFLCRCRFPPCRRPGKMPLQFRQPSDMYAVFGMFNWRLGVVPMTDARETVASSGDVGDAEAVPVQAKKAWQTPKVTRLDGKRGPLNSLGPSSDGFAPSVGS